VEATLRRSAASPHVKAGARRGSRGRVGDDVIYREVYDAIIDHRLPPGTALPEDTLASAVGVSRTVVRKAIIRLAHDRLVELRPNRGATVARPTVKEARELFEARRMVEPTLIAMTIGAIDEVQLQELRRSADEERSAFTRGDRRTLIRLSGDFHRRLAQIAGNDVLSDFLGELISRTSLVIALYELPGIWPCSLDEHLRLLELIARRDESGAATLMRDHLDHCEQQLDLTGASKTVDLRALFAHVQATALERQAS
jgi:DNA-binding GntR family transcriptional regulator